MIMLTDNFDKILYLLIAGGSIGCSAVPLTYAGKNKIAVLAFVACVVMMASSQYFMTKIYPL